MKTLSRTNTTVLKIAFEQIDKSTEEKQYEKVTTHLLNQIQKFNTGEENTENEMRKPIKLRSCLSELVVFKSELNRYDNMETVDSLKVNMDEYWEKERVFRRSQD